MKHVNPMLQIVVTAGVVGLLSAAATHAQRGGNGVGDKGPSYRIIRLDTDDGNGGTLPGYAFDINTSRLIVGEVDVAPACWTVTELDGEFQSGYQFLDRASFPLGHARGCNEWDSIVGLVYDDDGAFDPVAVYWASPLALLEELPVPLDRSAAFAINDSSVICGWSSTLIQDEYRAILWSFTGGAWKYLELAPLGDPGRDENGDPLPDQAIAQAISDADDTGVITVVGQSNGNAVAWTVMQDDSGALLAGPATIFDSAGEPQALNNRKVVCGFAGGLGGAVWVDGGAPEPLALDPSETWSASIPYDVNDGGLLVGHNDVHAVLWPDKDAPLIVLGDFLPRRKSPFYSLDQAPAVNESNEIVGAGRAVQDGFFLPFLAVPEQTSSGGRP